MDQKATEKAITYFIEYLFGQVELFASLQTKADPRYSNLYKKILYVAILDSMSRTVFPTKGNRERFVRFLRFFSGWKEGDHVSLPHLVQLLAKAPDPNFQKLRKFANQELDKWASGEINPLDRDPTFDTVRKLWPSDKEHRFPIDGVELESLQHWHLAYTYRNSLVHEFRTLGRGGEIREEGSSYYITFTMYERASNGDLVESSETWELVYTVAFFHELCTTCLKNLDGYLKGNRIDPYSLFDFGSYWISDLN